MLKYLFFFVVVLSIISVIHAASCSNPKDYQGQVVCYPAGSYCGECVSFVKKCTGDSRRTASWKPGNRVRGNQLPYGTAIATFPGGSYRGHAAIYVGQNKEGIQVWDQWKGRPVNPRTIGWGGKRLSNNGDSYYVIQ